MCSGIPAVALRPRTYMTNLLGYADTIAQTGTVFAPAGDARITFIDPRDVASAAATVLTARGPVDETYLLTGPEAIGFEQIAHDLSVVTGRSIGYVPVPDEAAHQAMLDAGLPAMVADFIVGVYRSQRAGSMSETNDRLLSLIEPAAHLRAVRRRPRQRLRCRAAGRRHVDHLSRSAESITCHFTSSGAAGVADPGSSDACPRGGGMMMAATDVAVIAGSVSTVVFVASYLPMLLKAVRSKDLSSYSAIESDPGQRR